MQNTQTFSLGKQNALDVRAQRVVVIIIILLLSTSRRTRRAFRNVHSI